MSNTTTQSPSLEDIGQELSLFLATHLDNNISQDALLFKKNAEDSDLSAFVDKIVSDVVVGPLQEVFTGKEIEAAINTKKALSFSSAFLDMAAKITQKSMEENRSVENTSSKDFRDVFVMSILSLAMKSNRDMGLISMILQDYAIYDERSEKLHAALVKFYLNETDGDASGAITLPLMFHRRFSSEEDSKGDLLWSRPVQIDFIFKN